MAEDSLESLDDEFDSESEEGFSEIDAIEEKAGKSKTHSLEVRRAIEDNLERERLSKEIDYLYDDDFGEEDLDEDEG